MLGRSLEPAILLGVIAILLGVTFLGGGSRLRYDPLKSRIRSIFAARRIPTRPPRVSYPTRRRRPRRDRFDRRKQSYEGFLDSPEWMAIRRSVLTRDQHRCQRCGATEGLHVHHLTYESRGRELNSDLTTLCSVCHKFVHDHGLLGVSEQYRYRQSRLSGKDRNH